MQAPGKIVKVNDTYMHVYHIPQQTADHKNTIVFLSGSGTECPTYDFKPLWHLLAGRINMVVVERPGYGWSGQTGLSRDIDTILEETREALKKRISQDRLFQPLIQCLVWKLYIGHKNIRTKSSPL